MELEDWLKFFKQMDVNGNKTLDKEEFKEGLYNY